MWRTYQQYIVAQKALAVVVAPIMLELIFPYSYSHKQISTISYFFYVTNVVLFVWTLATVPLGVHGAKTENKAVFYVVICGLLLQIVVGMVEIVLASRFFDRYTIYYVFGKNWYADSVAVSVFCSFLTLVLALMCLSNFENGLLAHRNVLWLILDETNPASLSYSGTVSRPRVELEEDELEGCTEGLLD